ncbi:preprotein translocase subunit YajC [Nocardioidaceae bacterium SCSIO 66511]|nr:preprotein translocase subunit YajC [Nocardioidaceae bacterium SCSIO 66511]
MTQEDLYALLPFVLLALVFWFLVFRPARKRQREAAQTQSSLEVGARIMLTSGIFGEVVAVHDAEIEVEISPGTVITAHRQAVGRVIPEDVEPAESLAPAADDETADDSVSGEDPTTDTASVEEAPELPTHKEK